LFSSADLRCAVRIKMSLAVYIDDERCVAIFMTSVMITVKKQHRTPARVGG
jgi:hypothetical protein